jgi:hypothetical protein
MSNFIVNFDFLKNKNMTLYQRVDKKLFYFWQMTKKFLFFGREMTKKLLKVQATICPCTYSKAAT